MCRGIDDEEVKTIQTGLRIEDSMYVASKLYMPARLYALYRRGAFMEQFSVGELKHITKIVITMHCIHLLGHVMFKEYTKKIY